MNLQWSQNTVGSSTLGSDELTWIICSTAVSDGQLMLVAKEARHGMQATHQHRWKNSAPVANVMPCTTGNTWFAECKNLCRVLNFGHSVKTCFAERRTRQNMALGKDLHSAKAIFAECLALGKGRHSAKIGRGLTASSGVLFAECPPFGTRQRIYFAECQNFTLGKIIFFGFLPPIFLKL